MWPVAPEWTTSYGLSVILESTPATGGGTWTVGKEYSLLGLVVDNTAPATPYGITFDDADHFRIIPLSNVKLNRQAP